ncbi:hypothetical protein KL930_003169 [Ogataea haglerorum]|uniref:Uncharacterized protein n=1 Tax=Ogataea haglerorum TaxID=1937702 RepID=A0AAN6D377_9ASCO|nr:uncharacterized protein KL911_002578 [Ogataea haglerorum]KAG7696142.1 hypothetical protein KL915_002506 [Ogataea haglerorum]KAG7696514.1 hypothetical protein KL951_002970 [Ogataea haglerorum]KAG7707042.1 hypothetical protein KL914_002926 [Ogataea haglerorum]KAG7708651.1 hypothetical protein KL950_002171 [Ogataea haglerorum]KAG7713822.1 hypothetical protein KL913_004846 [Ogataea haglerorum]
MFRVFRRCHSTLGFVFDIDGVLLKGHNAIPEATEALNTLQAEKVPFILLTNGGGVLESARCEFISQKLKLQSPLLSRQIVQSHTPLRTLVNKHRRVLVVGGPADSARGVAQEYGFREVLRPIDLIRANSNIWPFHKYSQQEIDEWSLDPEISKVDVDGQNEPIDSIMVFNDPRDMGSDFQIIMDLLNSEDGLLGTRRTYSSSTPSVPIVFSNNDLLWATDFKLPRFGQGAFKIMIQALYQHTNNGKQLQQLTLGKPYKVTYDYAHHVLIDFYENLQNGDFEKPPCLPQLNVAPANSPFDRVFMVGDNPESDILGGNAYNWDTILVRTGVFKDGDFEQDSKLAKPTFGTFDNVRDGVFAALEKYA